MRQTPDYQVHSDVNPDNCFAGAGGQILPSWMASLLRLLSHLGHTAERHLDLSYPSLQRTVRNPMSHISDAFFISHGAVGLRQSWNKYCLMSIQLCLRNLRGVCGSEWICCFILLRSFSVMAVLVPHSFSFNLPPLKPKNFFSQQHCRF